MTMSPEEALNALKAEEAARKAPRTPLLTALTGIVLAALAAIPSYLGIVHAAGHDSKLWLVLGLVLGFAMLGSSFMTTGKPRDRDRTYGVHYLATVVVSTVILAALAVMALSSVPTWEHALRNCLFLLIAPVVASLSFVVMRALRRK